MSVMSNSFWVAGRIGVENVPAGRSRAVLGEWVKGSAGNKVLPFYTEIYYTAENIKELFFDLESYIHFFLAFYTTFHGKYSQLPICLIQFTPFCSAWLFVLKILARFLQKPNLRVPSSEKWRKVFRCMVSEFSRKP